MIELYDRTGLAAAIGVPYRQFMRTPEGEQKLSQPETALVHQVALRTGSPANEDGITGIMAIVPPDPPLPANAPRILANREPARLPIKLYHPFGSHSATFSPCGKFIAIGGRAGPSRANLYVWNAQDISPDDQPKVIATQDEDFYDAAYSPDGVRIVTAGKRSASIWYATGQHPRIRELAHGRRVVMCAYSRDGRFIATTSWDGKARLWNALSGGLVHEFTLVEVTGIGNEECVNCAYFSPDMLELIVCTSKDEVVILDIATGNRKFRFPIEGEAGICSAEYSPDGKFIATADGHLGTVTIWDACSKERLTTLGGNDRHRGTIWSAEYSSDGSKILTASKDGFAHI